MIIFALLAGLLYFGGMAQAAHTLTILDNETGGDCTRIGVWDNSTKICTLNTDLEVSGIDVLHIEGNGITVDGAGHILKGNDTSNGVYVNGFAGITVRNLEVRNFSAGISLNNVTDSILRGDNVHNNGTGIYVSGYSSSGNRVIRNSVTLNGEGIWLDTYVSNSEVVGNSVIGNTGNGINLRMTTGIAVKGNSISANGTGFLAFSATDCRVYNNVFDGNTTQAAVVGGTTSFNLPAPIGGNWWSDWIPPAHPDNNGDGFVDEAYFIFLSGYDYLPWVTAQAWDQMAPTITNLQPAGTAHTGAPTMTADYTDAEPSSGVNLASAVATFTSGPAPLPTLSCTAVGSPTGTMSCTPSSYLRDGDYTIRFMISDNMGNTVASSHSFSILPYHITDTVSGGDCADIGTWAAGTKTCTLNRDLAAVNIDGIHIESNGVTLDGAGHTISQTGQPSQGIVANVMIGVAVRDLTVTGFQYGISINSCATCSLSNVSTNSNYYGVMALNSSALNISSSTSSGNDMGYYISGSGLALTNNNADNNTGTYGTGFWIQGMTNSSMTGNTAMANGRYGIFVAGGSSGSLLRGNRVDSNQCGFYFGSNVQHNTVQGNIVMGNTVAGLYLTSGSNWNVVSENSIMSNNIGLYIISASGNLAHSNRFAANDNNAWVVDGVNQFNGDESVGGNYWDTFDTPAEGCTDADLNGFCDAAYTFIGGQDNEPWTVDEGWKPEYYWTWYDQQSPGAMNWVLLANPASATSDVWYDLAIAGTGRTLPALAGGAAGQVPAGMAITPTYNGLIGGPVEVGCRASTKGLASQRIIWAGNSMEEVMGTDAARLSSHFYWTWYDQQSPGFTNWVMVANPSHIHDVFARIKVAGVDKWHGQVAAGQNVTPTFPGVMGGPVEVEAWSDAVGGSAPANVMASQRVLSNYGTAFNEVPGIPAGELSTGYIWTWYDQQSAGASNWVLVANPKDFTIYYQIKVAGTAMPGGSGALTPGSIATPAFPGKMGGPVEVSFWKDSVGGTLITEGIASQRSLWGPSFEEVPGQPVSQLGAWLWTWYDQQSAGMSNWVMIANTNADAVYYELNIAGGAVEASGTIPSGASVTPALPGVIGGPVEVTAWKSEIDPGTGQQKKAFHEPVMASQRVLHNGYFNEVVGKVSDSA